MTVTEQSRHELLERYGRWYGQERLAVEFTATIEGEAAKRVTAKGWDTTMPLADGDYGAALVAGRGLTHNPAVILRPSNLVVLECDSEQDLLAIEALDLPTTITVRSSKPYKRHYWFRPPHELGQLPYVAFRFESGQLTADSGRYFLAPPSIHPSGAIYAFLPDLGPEDVDIAELPEDVYRRLADESQQSDEQLRERLQVEPDAKIPEGKRRDTIFRYASAMRRWTSSRAAILTACLAYNDAHCDPVLTREQVEMQVDGAMKMPGGQDLARILDEPPLPEWDDPGPEWEVTPNAPHTDDNVDSWVPIDLTQLPERPRVQPTLGQVGIAYPGKRHIFSGPQESAKTLAAYAIAIEVIRQGGTVILIDFEMGQWDARDRMRELGATDDEISRGFHYIEPERAAQPTDIANLLAINPTLVIVDAAAGAYDLQGLDDNKRQDVERFTSVYVRDFWRAGVATIVLDHVVKNTETRGKYAIGSERKVGGADVHLGFEVITAVKRGTHGLYKLVTHKDRGGFLKRGTLANLELASDPDSHKITWAFTPAQEHDDDHPFVPTIKMQQVSDYLHDHQDEDNARSDIEKGVGGRADLTRKAIDELIRLGHAVQEGGPRGAKLVRFVSKYTLETTSSHLVPPRPGRGQHTSSHLVPPLQGDGDGDDAADDLTSSRSWADDPELQKLLDDPDFPQQ